MSRDIVLSGGGPWGFTLSGGKDFGAPLKVSKVRGLKTSTQTSADSGGMMSLPVIPLYGIRNLAEQFPKLLTSDVFNTWF